MSYDAPRMDFYEEAEKFHQAILLARKALLTMVEPSENPDGNFTKDNVIHFQSAKQNVFTLLNNIYDGETKHAIWCMIDSIYSFERDIGNGYETNESVIKNYKNHVAMLTNTVVYMYENTLNAEYEIK